MPRSSYGTPVTLIRLNYANDLRYGVLHDIAQRVLSGELIDLGMGAVNAIWQGDANRVILQSFALCASPARALNLTGPETISVRWLARTVRRAVRPRAPLSRRRRGTMRCSRTQRNAAGCSATRTSRCPRWWRGRRNGSNKAVARWPSPLTSKRATVTTNHTQRPHVFVQIVQQEHSRMTQQAEPNMAGDTSYAADTPYAPLRARLRAGMVIPAHPLALNAARQAGRTPPARSLALLHRSRQRRTGRRRAHHPVRHSPPRGGLLRARAATGHEHRPRIRAAPGDDRRGAGPYLASRYRSDARARVGLRRGIAQPWPGWAIGTKRNCWRTRVRWARCCR